MIRQGQKGFFKMCALRTAAAFVVWALLAGCQLPASDSCEKRVEFDLDLWGGPSSTDHADFSLDNAEVFLASAEVDAGTLKDANFRIDEVFCSRSAKISGVIPASSLPRSLLEEIRAAIPNRLTDLRILAILHEDGREAYFACLGGVVIAASDHSGSLNVKFGMPPEYRTHYDNSYFEGFLWALRSWREAVKGGLPDGKARKGTEVFGTDAERCVCFSRNEGSGGAVNLSPYSIAVDLKEAFRSSSAIVVVETVRGEVPSLRVIESLRGGLKGVVPESAFFGLSKSLLRFGGTQWRGQRARPRRQALLFLRDVRCPGAHRYTCLSKPSSPNSDPLMIVWSRGEAFAIVRKKRGDGSAKVKSRIPGGRDFLYGLVRMLSEIEKVDAGLP